MSQTLPPASRDDGLRQKITNICFEMGSVSLPMITALENLITDTVEHVIGPDIPKFKYIDSLVDNKKRKACNKLIAQQRQRYQELLKEK